MTFVSDTQVMPNYGGKGEKVWQYRGIARIYVWASPPLGLRAFPMCGIVGLALDQGAAALSLYEALLMLQHRGQDAAGMVTLDQGQFFERKKNGLVTDVFGQRHFARLPGQMGLGHVRYPTAGTASAREAQPFFVGAPFGIFLVHNGNLTNTAELRLLAQARQRRHFRTSSDTEVLLATLADEIQAHYAENPEARKIEATFGGLKRLMNQAEGAYSALALVDSVGLVGFRDPHGIRPLSLGHRVGLSGRDEYALASETIAFEALGFETVRDIAPGEAVVIDKDGVLHSRQLIAPALRPCVFEYIYLARPDSVQSGISVYEFQKACGRKLASQIKDSGWNIDVIVPVPDGARPAAMEAGRQLNIDYGEGLIKNRYVGRTFIMPTQDAREKSVRRKLNANPAVLQGRNVLLIDDSIVRGTTMRKIVELCRTGGATKVYVASASPPVRYPNVYGVDLPTREEFVAADLTIEEIRQELGADGLLYQTLEDLVACGQELNPDLAGFEDSVFSGTYLHDGINAEYLEGLANQGRGAARTVQRRLPLTV